MEQLQGSKDLSSLSRFNTAQIFWLLDKLRILEISVVFIHKYIIHRELMNHSLGSERLKEVFN